MEEGRLEIAGLESGSGLIMGDFIGNSGHEGRRAWRGELNVGSSGFHEGRDAGKKTTRGGRIIVNGKKIISGKAKVSGETLGKDMLNFRQRYGFAGKR